MVWDRSLKIKAPKLGRDSRILKVSGGENLKTLRSLEKLLKSIQKLPFDVLGFVSVGGGTVSDTVGFLASVYKRGRPVIHVPTTPLAALDSVHGGKTALNLGLTKNLLGTFWEADQVWLLDFVLESAPETLFEDAFSELLKMALLSSESSVEKLCDPKEALPSLFLANMSYMIHQKRAIVALDPLEKRGLRRILNLGHTLAHVLELHRGLSHGRAVGLGLRFALRWSEVLCGLNPKWIDLCEEVLALRQPHCEFEPIDAKSFVATLSQDKKRAGSRIQEVFLSAPGEPVLLDVSIQSFLEMGQRMGWVRGT